MITTKTTKQEEKKPIEPVGGTECRSVKIKELQNYHEAKMYNHTHRFIDDLCSINNNGHLLADLYLHADEARYMRKLTKER